MVAKTGLLSFTSINSSSGKPSLTPRLAQLPLWVLPPQA